MKRVLTALTLTYALLTGCAALSVPDRDVVMRLDPPTPPSRIGVSVGGAILLAQVRATGSASGRRYTYIDPASPREVRQAKTLYWEEPPSVLMDQALQKGLSARLGRPVVSGLVAPGLGARLNVELERFEERAGADAAAFAALRVDLSDGKTRALIFTTRYCATSPILGRRPSDRSAAFEAVTSQILDRLGRDIAKGSAAEPNGGC